MKVYVDELPKECFECPCFEGIETPAFFPCRLDFIENDKVQNYHKFDECNDNVCPLQSLSDYTKQVRKEVCEEISGKLNKIINSIKYNPSFYDNEYRKSLEQKAVYKNIFKILDQIQGETK